MDTTETKVLILKRLTCSVKWGKITPNLKILLDNVPDNIISFYLSYFIKCPVSCGGGVTSRKVRCNNKRIPVLCDASKKPSTTKSCNVHHCPKWTFSRWSEVSKRSLRFIFPISCLEENIILDLSATMKFSWAIGVNLCPSNI